MVEIIKKLATIFGFYRILEWLIINTNVGLNAYLLILGNQILSKNFKLELDKSSSNLKILISRNEDKIIISARHYAYLQDIIRNFTYYFNAVQAVSESGANIVDYSTPRQHLLLPSLTPFFFSSFAEPLETTKIYLDKGNLKEGDIVLDLGSYCGSTVWGFSNAVGKSGKVYGFEPDPINYKMLSRNIDYHSLSNVVRINKGVWSHSGSITFQGEGNMGSGISTIQNRSIDQVVIQTISLSDFCKEFNIERIDFIKMDIEGAEIEVLKTSGDILNKYKPRLIIEPHKIGSHLVTDEVCNILSTYGYSTDILGQSDLPLPLIYAVPEKI